MDLSPEQARELRALQTKIANGTASAADVVALHDFHLVAGNPLLAAVIRQTRPLDFLAAEADGVRPLTVSNALDSRKMMADFTSGLGEGMSHNVGEKLNRPVSAAQDATMRTGVSVSAQDPGAMFGAPPPRPPTAYEQWQAAKSDNPFKAAAFYQANTAAIRDSWPSNGGGEAA